MPNLLTTKGNKLTRVKAQITKLNVQIKELKAQQMKLEFEILEKMEKDGVEQYATASTTFFPSTKTRVKVDDKEEFLDYVFKKKAYYLLTTHVAQEPAREEREVEGDVPGVSFEELRVLNTRTRK